MTVISRVIALAVAALALAACSPAPSHHHAAATPAVSTAITSPPAPPGLKPGDARFVSDIRAHLASGGFSNTTGDAQIAHVGDLLCHLVKLSGSGPAAQIASARSESEFNYTGKQVVALAVRDICPRATQKSHG